MDNVSILDQIMDNKKAEEVNNLDAVEIINNLFSELAEREVDVLIRRYGLHSGEKETLESIGNAHKLTRERIRQIETSSVKKLQQLKNLEGYVDTLKKVICQLLEEHGGLMEREYMLEILAGFSADGFKSKEQDELIHKNYLNFMITKLLNKEFEEVTNSNPFKASYRLKYQDLAHLEEIAEDIHKKILEVDSIHGTKDLIEKIKNLESYNKHREKVEIDSVLDISRALKNDFYEERSDVINDNKVLYAILKASKEIEQNKFGHWGAKDSREIKPKTINDKIYLILKNLNKPLHFSEIAEHINKIAFDHKKANAATVHNELILDKKYILVGRGLYGLSNWGYKKGTVSDVIDEVLKEASGSLTRDEVIKRVLEKRLVKKATIILALMNKDKSKKEGKYISTEAI
ncbi:MAG: sigma factor-like helix-turn-helix DNA-binding protein [bacterium]